MTAPPLALLGLPVLCIQAPSQGEAWNLLYADGSSNTKLEWRVRPAETGTILQIRNTGPGKAHFALRIGAESDEQVRARGRVHLDPGLRMIIPLNGAPSGVSVSDVHIGASEPF